MGSSAKTASATILEWTEQGRVPDAVVRAGIRRLCRQRLKDIEAFDIEASARRVDEFVRLMDSGPIAPVPELANEQHYEVPAEFFGLVMGNHRKYSSCYWGDGIADLATAEERAPLDAWFDAGRPAVALRATTSAGKVSPVGTRTSMGRKDGASLESARCRIAT